LNIFRTEPLRNEISLERFQQGVSDDDVSSSRAMDEESKSRIKMTISDVIRSVNELFR
jgi:hypothetical protein